MRFTPSIVIDAPGYYVDHFHNKKNVDKCLILRDKQLESDSDSMPASFRHLPRPINILDLSGNELQLLPNLRDRRDIHTLLVSGNNIKYINGKQLPCHLQNLIISNNDISSFSQLKKLHHAPKSLKTLSLRGNPVCHLQDYRLHVLRYVPHLKVLDFQNVTKEELKNANKPLENKSAVSNDEPTTSIDTPAEKKDKNVELMNIVVGSMSEEQRNEIKQKLANATSLNEIMELERLLSGGTKK